MHSIPFPTIAFGLALWFSIALTLHFGSLFVATPPFPQNHKGRLAFDTLLVVLAWAWFYWLTH